MAVLDLVASLWIVNYQVFSKCSINYLRCQASFNSSSYSSTRCSYGYYFTGTYLNLNNCCSINADDYLVGTLEPVGAFERLEIDFDFDQHLIAVAKTAASAAKHPVEGTVITLDDSNLDFDINSSPCSYFQPYSS